MRDRMERFVLLPFSVGCVSESSIAVAIQSRKQVTAASDHKSSSSSSSAIRKREEDEESLSSNESTKSSSTFRFLAISKPNISTGFHRLFKSFKFFSQLFVYKEEEEIEEMGKEMEIGFPTDVKHVTHIGIDGSSSSSSTTTTNNNIPINGWQDHIIPSISLEQFDLVMTSQQNVMNNDFKQSNQEK